MRIGPYEVTRTIGEGGMGHVYAARAPGGDEVALKVLLRGGPEVAARFERERRLLGSFGEGDGFVPLLDAGTLPGGAFLVMPLLTGGTLRARLARGPLGAAATVELARALAAALGAAHARGIVHRDMKPENVLFTSGGAPLVADLGLAKHFDPGRTGASQSVSLSQGDTLHGTAGYMAPEQASDAKTVGPPANVFALGVILYECLAGDPPFLGETFLDAITKVLAGEFTPLHERAPDAPAWLVALVERALAPEAGDRFADGLAVLRALERAEAPARRGPLAAGVGGLVLVSGLALAWLLAAPKAPPPRPARPKPAPVRSATVPELLANAASKLARSDWTGAAADCSRAIELEPENAAAWAGRASARTKLADRDGAIADATRAIELAPGVSVTWAVRGQNRMAKNDADGALADLTRALELDPRNAEALGNRGAAKLAKRDLDGAIEDCEEALALDPTLAPTWGALGTARAAKGDPARAVADLTRALDLDPTLVRAHGLRGLLRAEANDRENALSDLDAYFAAVNDDSVETRTIREKAEALHKAASVPAEATKALEAGRAKEKAGSHEDAIRDYSRAIELAPTFATGWADRAVARAEANDLDGALSDATRALELAPADAGFFGLRAHLRSQRSDWKGAVDDLTRSIALDPATATQALLERSLARERLGDHDGAIDDLTKALEREPRNAEALVKRGLIRTTYGDPAAAIPDFERFLELAPNDPNAPLVRSLVAKAHAAK